MRWDEEITYSSPCGSCGRRSAYNNDIIFMEKICKTCDYRRLLEKEEEERKKNECSE